MRKILMTVGVLVAVMPFLGFPNVWKTTFFVLAGLFLFVVAFGYRSGSKGTSVVSKVSSTFTENNLTSTAEETSEDILPS